VLSSQTLLCCCIELAAGMQTPGPVNTTTCPGAGTNIAKTGQPKVCVIFPGTGYGCIYETSPMTKPCRKASDVCDITDFCE
jgi:hypothetical protein